MERYFLGNNTAYGFKGNYESELGALDRSILLKGGPGTGKSSILKRLAKEAKERGYDVELWYCSGDPDSLDGVKIKELNVAVTDATSPHASGADIPKIKDFIIDLADSLSTEKLSEHKTEIEALLKCKKKHFMRAYQHLKSALCHLRNQFELERAGLDEAQLRAFAASFALQLKRAGGAALRRVRRVFTEAICPDGENAFFDHLEGKRVYKVNGGELAISVFFEELASLLGGGTLVLNPLDDTLIDGVLTDGVAVVRDPGPYEVYENIDLHIYEDVDDMEYIEEERSARLDEIKLAKSELNAARRMHLDAETYFVAAMDFENNDRLYDEIRRLVFED